MSFAEQMPLTVLPSPTGDGLRPPAVDVLELLRGVDLGRLFATDEDAEKPVRVFGTPLESLTGLFLASGWHGPHSSRGCRRASGRCFCLSVMCRQS